jgi:hypothetical protein
MNEEMMKEMAEKGGGGGADAMKEMAAAMAYAEAMKIVYYVVGLALIWAAGTFFYQFWDRRSADSAIKDDNQVGLKIALFSFLIFCVGLAAIGLEGILGYLLAGAKNTPAIKQGLGNLLSGGALFGATFLLLVPRTNTKDYPQTERYAVGFVAIVGGLWAFASFAGLLDALFLGANWKAVSSAQFAALIVAGALTFVALMRLGQMSGWTAPARMPSAPPGFPPAGGGGGGYQQPGYPQQQGYPQQGGYQQPGYPPQGGYPPAGGGYPPQGGGGLPPPGGYQPR